MMETFNQQQIEFIEEQQKSWDSKQYNFFEFEDEMWYVFNRSGLFEEIIWSPTLTRRFITERK